MGDGMYQSDTVRPMVSIWMLLRQTWEAMDRAMARELHKLGTTPAKADMLQVLKNSDGPLSITEIARQLFREPHTIQGLISRMEKEGLVKRLSQPGKGKPAAIAITERGEELLKRIAGATVVYKVMSCLSEEDYAELEKRLQLLRRSALEELIRDKMSLVA